MRPVTDPALLQQLDAPQAPGLRPVSDPRLLAQLDGDDEQAGLRAKARQEIEALGGPGLPNISRGIPVIGPFLDEASAAIQGGVRAFTGYGRSYDEALAFEREREAMARAQSPTYATLGNLTTGLVIGGPVLGRGMTATTTGGKMAQGAGLGAIVGGAEGVGNAEGGGVADWMADGAQGAALGGAVGAIAPPVMDAVGRGVSRVADAMSPTIARWTAGRGVASGGAAASPQAQGFGAPGYRIEAGADAASDQVIANQMIRAGVSVDDLRRRLAMSDDAAGLGPNSVAQNVTAPVDLDPSLQRLAAAVGRQQPEAANIGQRFIVARQTGQTGRQPLAPEAGLPTRAPMTPEGATPMGQYERVKDAFARALQVRSQGTANATDDGILAAQKREATRLYSATWRASKDVDLKPVLAPIQKEWTQRLADEPVNETANALKRVLERVDRVVTTPGYQKSQLERFDQVKQWMDSRIEKLMRAGDRYLAGKMIELKNNMLEAIDGLPNVGALYAEARGTFGSHAQMREALQLGRQAWKEDSDVTADVVRSLSAGERTLFRIGLHDAATRDLARPKRTADIVQKFESPRVQELVREAIPVPRGRNAEFADRPERFGRWLQGERQMIETRNTVLGGSPTARNQADDEALSDMLSIVETMRSAPTSITATAYRVLADTINRVFGFRADTATAIARKLFTADPRQQEIMLARLADRIGTTRSRAEYINLLMDQYNRALTQAGINAAALSQRGE